jgi:histidine decarboxylase
LKQVNKDGQLHVVPASIKGQYIIRFTVTSYYTTEDDIKRDWEIIKETAKGILKMREDKSKYDRFQSSLLLSNVSQTPKFVNASFAAFFPDPDLLFNIVKELNTRDYTQSQMPLTPRGKLKFFDSQKQLSFEYSKSLKPSQKKVNFKNRLEVSVPRLRQQASLDSKIESIFDEQEYVQKSKINIQSQSFQQYSNGKLDSEDDLAEFPTSLETINDEQSK